MDASITQLVLNLSQQNLELSQEVARLRVELAKYQSVPVVSEVPPVPPKKVNRKVVGPPPEPEEPPKPTKKKINISPEGHAAKVLTGHRVAALNAIRKEFMLSAQLNGEW